MFGFTVRGRANVEHTKQKQPAFHRMDTEQHTDRDMRYPPPRDQYERQHDIELDGDTEACEKANVRVRRHVEETCLPPLVYERGDGRKRV